MLKPKFKSMSELVEEYRHLLVDLGTVKPTQSKSKKTESKKVVTEAKKAAPSPVVAERAPLSKYSSPRKAIDSFKVLAGIEEREIMPWDPGLSATTKFEDGLLAEACMTDKKKA